MSLSFVLHSGKNPKLMYYARNILRYLVPRALLRQQLPRLLKKAAGRKDYPYMLERVNYYNKLSAITGLPGDAPTLKNHTYRNQSHKGVYFWDTYEYTRFFDEAGKWY